MTLTGFLQLFFKMPKFFWQAYAAWHWITTLLGLSIRAQRKARKLRTWQKRHSHFCHLNLRELEYQTSTVPLNQRIPARQSTTLLTMPSPAKGICRDNPAAGYRYGRPEISKADRQVTFLLQRQKFTAILKLMGHLLPIVGFPET